MKPTTTMSRGDQFPCGTITGQVRMVRIDVLADPAADSPDESARSTAACRATVEPCDPAHQPECQDSDVCDPRLT